MFAHVVGFLVFFVLIPMITWAIFKFAVRPILTAHEQIRTLEASSKLRHRAFTYRYTH